MNVNSNANKMHTEYYRIMTTSEKINWCFKIVTSAHSKDQHDTK